MRVFELRTARMRCPGRLAKRVQNSTMNFGGTLGAKTRSRASALASVLATLAR